MASFPACLGAFAAPVPAFSRQKPANTRHGNDAPAIACKRFCGWRRNASSKGSADGLELPRILRIALLEAIPGSPPPADVYQRGERASEP